MTRIRQRGLAAAFAGSLALLGVAPSAVAATTSTTVSTVTLTRDVIPHLDRATLLGPTDPSRQLTLEVVLGRPDPAGEAQFEHDLYTAGSPTYHHFLTPAEYAARFGVPATTAASAVSFATAQGLSVVSVNPTRDVITLSGTVTQVERTFSVQISDFHAGRTTFFANTTGPTVPAGIGALGVIGLDDLLRAAPAQSVCAASVCTGLTTPQDLWKVYDLPTGDPKNPGTADFGQGQQMAIFGEGQTDPVISDLRTFEGIHGLPQVPVSVVHADGPNADYSDNSGLPEWDIDTQSSTGMAPDVMGLTLYFGHDLSDASTLSVLTAWAGDANGPLQASASYGECELNPLSAANSGIPSTDPGYAGSAGQLYTTAYEGQLQVAVAEGRTLFSSTGDTGSSCPVVATSVGGLGAGNGVLNQAYPVDNYPASSPHVVAVGGTVLYTTPGATASDPATGRAEEYAWTFTGGGPSNTFTKPDYQQGIGVIATPCVTDPHTGLPYASEGAAPPTCRGIPDIAAQSGDVSGNGYDVVNNGTDGFPGGGTSLASPLSLGMWTRIQAAKATGPSSGGNGFADEALYKLAGNTATDGNDFFDIGGGPQANSPVTNNGYFTSLPRNAGDPTGWDYVSGLGTFDVTHILTDLDHSTVPVNNVLPAPQTPSGSGAGGGGVTKLAPAQAACVPLFSGKAGSDSFEGNTGGNPQLDIVQGDMHTVTLSDGKTYLQTVLTINNLSYAPASAQAPLPTGAANEYYLLWTVGTTTYFSNAEVDTTQSLVTPTVAYNYGSVVVNGPQHTYQNNGTTTGSFNPGPNGTVIVNVPLTSAAVGAVAPGSLLANPSGETDALVGSPAVGGSLQKADTAGPSQDYTLGETCAATGKPGTSGGATSNPGNPLPEVPFALAAPLAAAAVGYGVLRRRRRRIAG